MKNSMSQDLKDKIKTTLQELLDGSIHVKSCGICYNLKRGLSAKGIYKPQFDAYDFVNQYSKGWEHPLRVEHEPGKNYLVISRMRDSNYTGVWEGNQLEARQSLIRHLLTKVDTYQPKEKTDDITT